MSGRVGFQQLGGLFRRHVAVADPRPVRKDQVQERLALAETDAAGAGHHGVQPQALDRLDSRGLDLPRPGGDPAGCRPDEDLQPLGVEARGTQCGKPIEVVLGANRTAHANCSRIFTTLSSFTLPKVTPSIRMAGASAQQPMQRTVRRVNRPLRIGFALGDVQLLFEAFQEQARAADEARGAQADFDRVPAHGRQAEGVVEAGHAEDLGQRNLQPQGQVLQHRAGQIAALVGHVLKDGDQRGPVVAIAGQDRIDPGRVLGREMLAGLHRRRRLGNVAHGASVPAIAAAGAFVGDDAAGRRWTSTLKAPASPSSDMTSDIVRTSMLWSRMHCTSLGEMMHVAQSPVGKVLSRRAMLPPIVGLSSTR